MRVVRFTRSSAAVVQQQLSLSSITSAPAAAEVGNVALANRPLREFAPLRIQPWQTFFLGEARNQLFPLSLLYHGSRLGPRPLIILDHTTRDATDVVLAAKKYEVLLSQLSWIYGAVYIPLHVDLLDAAKDWIGHSCQQVCAVMDALDVRWTHFLTYSYGSLVAARLAASEEFPHRIGTFTSLDTPLVTHELLRNMERREEIARAESDVNVPEAELEFAKHSLISALEGPLPCPAKADKSVYDEYLFHPASIFCSDGLVRREGRYVPVRHLADIRHPMQLVVPAANALADVGVHKELFGLRRAVVLKGCQQHEELFLESGAKELAGFLEAWMHRFEPDAYITKRYEQAAKEMSQVMAAAQTTTLSSNKEGGEQRKKKKEKNKKG